MFAGTTDTDRPLATLLRDVLPGSDRLNRANNSGVTPPQWPNGKQVIARSVALEATIPPDARDLETTIAVQAALIAELRAQVSELAAAKATLQARVAELERRLGRDSSNSSRPPSSDGLRKPQRRGRHADSGRRPGKQPGTPGAYLTMTGRCDQVVMHAPERCAGCGADLTDAQVAATWTRQVFDLPRLRLVVTEHRVERRRCACGQVTAGVFPMRVRAPVQYGPGVRALVAYLCVYQHLPVDRAAGLLGDVLGAPVAAGTLAAVVAEGAAGLGEFAAAVRDQLAGAPVAHFDETVRREAPGDRVGVKGLHRWAVAAARLKLRAA